MLPKSVRNYLHLFYAWYGSFHYGRPSEKLFVIGITGTSGKSSTIHFLRQILEHAGFKVGSLSTVDFYVAGEIKLNDKKMTMLGKMAIQKYLGEMVQKKCDIAIIETTSEGYLQYRHRFINYDAIILTNLYPEHIEAHGGFENYKKAKLGIFSHVARCRYKIATQLVGNKIRARLDGVIKKFAVINDACEYSSEFQQINFSKKILFGNPESEFGAVNIIASDRGLSFAVQGHNFFTKVFGKHNIQNISSAMAVARQLGVDWQTIYEAVGKLGGPPGRIEFIPEAEKFGFKAIVDYAFEPGAIQALYDVVNMLKPKRIIHVFGSTGGGRDKARRFTVGELVGKRADICIVTDEDPYDDNPQEIINDVASAVVASGKKENESVFKILDRKEAVRKAIQMAEVGDIVLITGKGSEQRMVVKGVMIPWDDRQIVRESLLQR